MAGFTLQGAATALVTPFTSDGSAVDWDAFEKLVISQIEHGIQGLVPCGTTGESPTLTASEQRELVERAVRLARGRVPVLAGVGSNHTQKAIELAQAAVSAGADAVMVVMPYYNKPSQDGLVLHVSMVAKSIEAPLVVYNIPGRTGVDLSVHTLLRLLDVCPNVVGLKDASGNANYCQELLRQAGDRIFVMCGDDALTLPLLAVGARGVISVTSNLYPAQVNAVVEAFQQANVGSARARHFALLPLHRAMFMEPSPAPIKAALGLKGLMRPAVRPPLTPATDACHQTLERAMREYEVT